MEGLSSAIIRRIVLLLPKEIEEQIAIVQVLSAMDSEIKLFEKKRDKYKEVKIGLMQQLFTGKIRLKEKN